MIDSFYGALRAGTLPTPTDQSVTGLITEMIKYTSRRSGLEPAENPPAHAHYLAIFAKHSLWVCVLRVVLDIGPNLCVSDTDLLNIDTTRAGTEFFESQEAKDALLHHFHLFFSLAVLLLSVTMT